MPSKKKKQKSKKRNKAKVMLVRNAIFTIIFFCVCSFLTYYFVTAFHNYQPKEMELVSIKEQPTVATSREIEKSDDHTKEILESASAPHEAIIETPEPKSTIPEARTPSQESVRQTPTRNRTKAYVINPNLPKICIIVDDFGAIGNSLFNKFNTVDREVAFAVLPGLSFSKEHMEKAVEVGREVLIHIPMEPENDAEKIEPNTIKVSMNDFQIKDQIESWMYELPLAVGVNNHMGSKATQDTRVLTTMMMTLNQNDMFFIDSVTTNNSKVSHVAMELGVKTAARNIFLDNPDTSLRGARQKIEQIKKMNNRDVIVVITHCHSDVKFRQLVHFIDRLKDGGYQLVTPSRIVE